MEVNEDVKKGQQVYNKFTLAIYDFLLFKLLTGLVWRCPTPKLLKLFANNMSNNHLDVGVGSGFLIDKTPFTAVLPRLALMDLNEECLNHCSKRLVRYQPKVYQHNVFEPFPSIAEKFDSISLNYLLHCLPGNISEKAVVFDHLFEWLNPGGVIFGCTVIFDSSEKHWLADKIMQIYNRKGVFSNQDDTISAFEQALSKRFENYELKIIGSAAQFIIKKPL